jgi:hypothetical protein
MIELELWEAMRPLNCADAKWQIAATVRKDYLGKKNSGHCRTVEIKRADPFIIWNWKLA